METTTNDSDLDIGAWWPSVAPAAWDVVVPGGVVLVVLSAAPLELASRIALEGVVLFDDDPAARVHWVADTRKIWLDERPRFERAHRDFIEQPVVDEGRVVRPLRDISDRTERLRAACASDPSSRDDLWLDGVEYLLVTTIESCVDVAQHLASSENFGAPDSNAAALRELGSRGVIDQTLASDLALAVGFRDVLVHQYALVDDAIVLAASERLDDFDQFVSQLSGWLVDQRD